MNTIQRLKEFIDFKGITVHAFEKAAELSNGSFASQLKNNKSIGVDKLEKILNVYPEISLDWLIRGKGPMLVTDIVVDEPERVQGVDAAKVYKLKTDRSVKHQDIPLYNIEATAGIVQLFSDATETEPVDVISVPNLPRCDGAVYVTGDSMYPLLKNGDIVMYKEIKNLPDGLFFGEMYLVSMDVDGDEFITVKWLNKSELGDEYIKLVSENRHHPPKDIKLKHVRAMALIKGSIRINSMF